MIDLASATENTIFRLAKRVITIHFGYRTRVIHVRVFSQTLAHGTARMKQRHREGDKKRGVKIWKEVQRARK